MLQWVFNLPNSANYVNLPTDTCQQLEAAVKSPSPKQVEISLDTASSHTVLVSPSPMRPLNGDSSLGVDISPDGSLVRYVCSWYFRNDTGSWSPMGPEISARLSAAMKDGSLSCSDGERDYDLRNFWQINRESQRKRPLLFIRPDRTGQVGHCVPQWGAITRVGARRGQELSVPLSLAACEALEAALQRGDRKVSVTVALPAAPATDNGDEQTPSEEATTAANTAANVVSVVEVTLKSDTSCQTHIGTVVSSSSCGGGGAAANSQPSQPPAFCAAQRQRLRFVRFYCTWLYFGDDSNWYPFDYTMSRVLDLASAAGHTSFSDQERTYDLTQFQQSNSHSGRTRPIAQLQSGVSAAPGLKFTTDPSPLREAHPEIARRLSLMTDPSRSRGELCRVISGGGGTTRAEIGAALCNVLLNRFRCAVKGGPVRDLGVLGGDDAEEFKDIDCEMDPAVTRATVGGWLDDFAETLRDDYGVEVLSCKARDSFDAFARVKIQDGIWEVKLDNDIDIELVSPWNLPYAPPRNVDLSCNNLRLVPGDHGVVHQNVAIGMDTIDIVNETVRKVTRTVYHVEYQPAANDDEGRGGDGAHGELFAVGAAPTPQLAKLMNGRLEKYRSRGFKFLPLR